MQVSVVLDGCVDYLAVCDTLKNEAKSILGLIKIIII